MESLLAGYILPETGFLHINGALNTDFRTQLLKNSLTMANWTRWNMPSKDASLKQLELTFYAMFSPPSPLLVETDLIVLVQEMLSRSIQFHRLEHWIMNMSKLVARCWILFKPFTLKTDQRKNSTKWSIFNLWNAEKQAYSTMWKYCRRGFRLVTHFLLFSCSAVCDPRLFKSLILDFSTFGFFLHALSYANREKKQEMNPPLPSQQCRTLRTQNYYSFACGYLITSDKGF